MKLATSGGTVALGCLSCGGVMLDTRSIEKMRADPGIRNLGESAAEHATGSTVDTEARGIPCPYCAQSMQRHQLFGVDIDLCPNHGTWFDRDELQAIIDRAREHEGETDPSSRTGASKAVAAAAVVGGVAGAAALGAAAVDPNLVDEAADHVERQASLGAEVALDGAVTAAEVGAEMISPAGADAAIELGGAAISTGAEVGGAALEGAGSIIGGIFEVLGSIFSG